MKPVENVALAMRRLGWGLLLGWVNAPKAFANSKAILRRQHQLIPFSRLVQLSKTYIEPVLKITTTRQSTAGIRMNKSRCFSLRVAIEWELIEHFKWGKVCFNPLWRRATADNVGGVTWADWLLTQLHNEILSVYTVHVDIFNTSLTSSFCRSAEQIAETRYYRIFTALHIRKLVLSLFHRNIGYVQYSTLCQHKRFSYISFSCLKCF